MTATSKDLLESAKRLQRGSVESDYRTGASRAYYAAYHACLPIGERVGLSAERNVGVHTRLSRTLTVFSKRTDYKSVGYLLRECCNIRVWADYELERDFSKAEGDFNVRQCTRIMGRTENLLTEREGPA